MGIPERSRERVEEYISGLERTYGSFPVSQTTVSLPGERYARVREHEREAGGVVDAYIQVRNDEYDVLHVGHSSEADLPHARVGFDGSPESRVREVVRETAGIECSIDGIERATIAGVRNADDPEAGTLYELILVFTGRRTAGVVGENAEWRSSPGGAQLLAI